MSQIGEPRREVIVEPLVLPEPIRRDEPAPVEPIPTEPIPAELVPVREGAP